MKTTIDIADRVFTAAKQLAAQRGTTVRALVEQGLRQVIAAEQQQTARFVLRRASFGGQGLQADLPATAWADLRDMAYQGRGT